MMEAMRTDTTQLLGVNTMEDCTVVQLMAVRAAGNWLKGQYVHII